MSTVIDHPQGIPRSSRRHRPIGTGDDIQPWVPRASRASNQPTAATSEARPSVPQRQPVHWLVPVVGAMVGTMILIWLLQIVWGWGIMLSNDLHYGTPRTTQVDAFVGHETGNAPSHFIALNLRGQVQIIEEPGGDPSKAHIFLGPQLTGSDASLQPVTLQFVKNPQSHKVDMIVQVGAIVVHYHNENGTFVQAAD